jgi:hypothetical protein
MRTRLSLARAAVVLVVIFIVVTGAALVLFSRSLSGIRGDFCAFTAQHYSATLQLQQVPARVQAEQSDLQLLRQLGCRE